MCLLYTKYELFDDVDCSYESIVFLQKKYMTKWNYLFHNKKYRSTKNKIQEYRRRLRKEYTKRNLIRQIDYFERHYFALNKNKFGQEKLIENELKRIQKIIKTKRIKELEGDKLFHYMEQAKIKRIKTNKTFCICKL